MASKACEVIVKRLWPVFGLTDPPIGVQLIRLVVLFEDLRIETLAGTEDHIEPLDENSAEYRKLYFVRRAYATLVEMRSALIVLAKTKEFKDYRQHFFTKSDDEVWDWAIKFFHDHGKFFKDERNLYGGHFHAAAAQFGLEHLNPDTVGSLEIGYVGRKSTWRIRFRFALHFVGVALTANKGAQSYEDYIPQSFEKLTEGFYRATAAIQLLARHFVLPKFGAAAEPCPQPWPKS